MNVNVRRILKTEYSIIPNESKFMHHIISLIYYMYYITPLENSNLKSASH